MFAVYVLPNIIYCHYPECARVDTLVYKYIIVISLGGGEGELAAYGFGDINPKHETSKKAFT